MESEGECLIKSICQIKWTSFSFVCMSIILLSMGCYSGAESPTPTPLYAHYVPPSDSSIRLEFDYPSTWVWKQIDSQMIMIIDPLEPTLQIGHEADVETGSISIRSEEVDPVEASLEREVDSLNQFMSVWYPNELLSAQEIQIDGYPAQRLTYRAEPNTGFGNQDFLLIEDIFLIVDNILYRIDFNIAQSNRSGPFGAGYDTMVESLKVVP